MPSAMPPIRALQFGGAADGIGDDVNLFRGDVNLRLPLLAMAGRNGLDVTVSALYQSNVARQALRWNLDAPTGVLGLGWDLVTERVVAGENDDYALVSGGNSGPLVRDDREWVRFEMPAGGTDLPTLASGFAAAGLALSDSAEVRPGGTPGTWTVADHGHARTFTLRPAGERWQVLAGGVSYQLQSFAYWQVRHYPETESWDITKDDGLTYVYGGSVHDADRRSLQWAVRWGTWGGASDVTHDGGAPVQRRVVRAWNLVEVRSRWHDAVSFAYDTVEQRVGAEGLAYTKACYLRRAVDVYGRSAEFEYGEKEFHDSVTDPEGAREYLDPHRALPSGEPGPYQDRYETRFLRTIRVAGPAGQPLVALDFDYEVGSVAPARGTLRGDTAKRFLTGVRQRNGDGDDLPGLRFEYHRTGEPDTTPLGALRAVTYPAGARVEYRYRATALPVCERSLRIERPAGWKRAAPRVWFGPDYAVVAWVDGDERRMRLEAYTWLGDWRRWEPAGGDLPGCRNADDLTVQAGPGWFAVALPSPRSAEGTLLYLYRRSTRRQGAWLEHDGGAPVRLPSRRITLAGGDEFLLAGDEHSGDVGRYTWHWPRRGWVAETLPGGGRRGFFTATGNRHLLVHQDVGTGRAAVTLHHLDDALAWHAGEPLDVDLPMVTVAERAQVAWGAGATLFALSRVTDLRESFYEYAVDLFQWQPGYTGLCRTTFPFRQDRADGETRIGFAPSVAADTLVGAGGNLLRFDGVGWRVNQQLNPTMPVRRENTFSFAYSDDVALMAQVGPERAQGFLDAFDPAHSPPRQWRPGALPLADAGRLPEAKRRFHATTGGGGLLSLDDKVYLKTPRWPWEALPDHVIHTLAPDTDTTTVINQGPAYLSALRVDKSGEALGTDLVVFDNGAVERVERLDEQYPAVMLDGRPNVAPGRYPAGPDAFFTYPLRTALNDTPSITLYRCVGGSLRDPIRAFVVDAVTADDGFDVRHTAYAYDTASAASEPDGRVVRFYDVSVAPGTLEPTETPFGRARMVYANGAVTDDPDTREILLDGMLLREHAYDAEGAEVSVSTTEYLAVDEIPDVDGTPVPLAGGLALPVGSTSVRDGVRTETRREPDLTCGHPRVVSAWSHNGDGVPELVRSRFTFGYQAYPQLRAWSLLSAVVQQIDEVQPAGAPAVVTGSEVTTWTTWPVTLAGGRRIDVAAQQATWRLAEPAADPVFPFAAAPASGGPWLRTSQITARDGAGLVTESADAEDRRSSVLYDRGRERTVAEFGNASLARDEAAYTGFEPYEQPHGWDLGAAAVVTDVAHTGTASLLLAAGVGPSRTFRPTGPHQRYLFGAWVRASEPAPGGRWSIDVTVDGAPVSRQEIAFPAPGRWEYVYAWIDTTTPGDRAAVAVTVAARNDGPGPVWIDDVCFRPLLSTFTATVFDALHGNPVASLEGADTVARAFANPWQSQAGGVSGDGVPKLLTAGYYSRQRTGTFDRAAPNATLALSARDGGIYDGFTDVDAWTRHWAPEPAADWAVREHGLHHEGAAAGTVRAVAGPERDYALYVQHRGAGAPAGVRIGDAYELRWERAEGRWAAFHDGVALPTLEQPVRSTPPAEWLLVAAPRLLLFYADGALVLRHHAAADIAGRPALFAAGPAAFAHLTVMAGPQLSVEFQDGAGRGRQAHAIGDAASTVSGAVFDAAGRPAVQTKSAAFPLADPATMGFRPAFVTGLDWTSGVMTGELADYYRGQDGRSDDQGFPYTRTRFEASPLGRAVERGLPGRAFAIADLDRRRPEDVHTTRWSYGANEPADVPALGLPPGEYTRTTIVDANGTVSTGLSTKLGDQIATQRDTGPAAVASGQRTRFDAAGTSVVQLPPNALRDGVLDVEWAATVRRDLLGRDVEDHRVDAGDRRYVYDRAGRLRFSLDARGERDGYVGYARYDPLGRPVETGTVAMAWDEPLLRRLAWQRPDFPDRDDGAHPERRQTYDGDGARVELIGRPWQAFTFDAAGEVAVAEEFGYDDAGNLTAHTVRAAAFDLADRTVRYRYDNLGDLTAVQYPDGGDGTAERALGYDRLGGLARLQDAATGTLVAFGYDANGSLDAETVTIGGTSIVRRLRYTPPGWLARHDYGDLLRERCDYTAGGVDGAGYHDGRVAAVSTELAVDEPGVPARTDWRFAYDRVGRLTAADAGDLYRLRVEAFDPNGNVERVSDGGTVTRYTLEPHSNRVRGTDGSDDAFGYDPVGNVTRSDPLGIHRLEYGRVTGLPTLIEAKETTAAVHDSAGQVVARRRGAERRLYLRGPDLRPLLTADVTAGGPVRRTRYVYGPDGLVAAEVDGHTYAVLRDRLGSTRALVDPATGRIVQALHYTPFGALLGAPGQPLVPYLYAGDEWCQVDPDAGLYDLGARLYDPHLRRFYAVDPAGQFPSPYLYAGDDPVDEVDPDGEFAFLALAIAVGIGLVVGAAAGGVTYEINRRSSGESFDGGKLALYMTVGAGAGALGGAAGFGAGALVGGGLATAGMATYSSAATGVIVGGVSGAVDGLVAGATSQLGWNLVDGKRGAEAFDGVGMQALIGGAVGGVTGGALGGIVGRTQARLGARLTRPDTVGSFAEPLSQTRDYVRGTGATRTFGSTEMRSRAGMKMLRSLLNRTNKGEVAGISSHGDYGGIGAQDGSVGLSAQKVANKLEKYRTFRGSGWDLRAICSAGENLAPRISKASGAPSLAAEQTTFVWGDGAVTTNPLYATNPYWRAQNFHIYHPSAVKTAWVRLFGY